MQIDVAFKFRFRKFFEKLLMLQQRQLPSYHNNAVHLILIL